VTLDLILVIDDDPQIGAAVRAALGSAAASVVQARSCAEALRLSQEMRPDVVILDLGLPDADGGDVCRLLRPFIVGPIIVLSARTEVSERVRLLELGADDFIAKPCSLRELNARIHAHARRVAVSAAIHHDHVAHSDGLDVDVEVHAAFRNGTRIPLTRIEWAILRTLLEHAGKMLTHRQLAEQVWGPGWASRREQLRFHITNLRRKIERKPTEPQIVITEPGVGYLLRLDPTP
jgi:two-component system KDP operon response regulator KdpE